MVTCPHCEEDIEAPTPETLLADEFFDDQFEIDVTVSGERHVQLVCPECDVILGYLGLAGAGGGPNTRIGYDDP